MNGYDSHSDEYMMARRDNRCTRTFGWRPVPPRDTLERHSEAELSTKKRNKLPASAFAIPEKRAYPVNDLSHARSALQRVAQYGSDEEKRRVRKAVARRFPEIRQSQD